jgi:hypothetical protein
VCPEKGVFRIMITYLDSRPVLNLAEKVLDFIEKNPDKWIQGAHYADSKKRPTFLGNPNVVYYDLTGMLWMLAKRHNIEDACVDYVIQHIVADIQLVYPECDNLSVYNDLYATYVGHIQHAILVTLEHMREESKLYGGRFKRVS